MKKIVFFLFIVLFSIFSVNSAKVVINANVYPESTIFDYHISFDQNETYKSFSFEKPKDGKLVYAIESGSNIAYSQSGDFFIFKPENIADNEFVIRVVSVLKSEEIINENLFSLYTNFNFPVEKLIFKIELKEDFGDISEIVPRSYEIDKSENIIWTLNEVTSDTFFLIKFTEKKSKSDYLLLFFDKYWHIGLLILVFIVFIYVAFIFKKKNVLSNINLELIKKPFEKKDRVLKQEIVNEEKFEELTSKYLTDNEKEIVEVVKNNSGISQYDILNHLPSITKSNLSKIISKLHSKHILSRIKVGKVNKIYLGDKIEKGSVEDSFEK